MSELPITQADRKLALEICEQVLLDRPGEMDVLASANIVARHRIASNTEAADLITELVEALREIPTAALYALRHGQQQADMDGTFVTVSRQALDEVLDAVDAALLKAGQHG